MESQRNDDLYKVLISKGYDEKLCYEIAYNQLNTDFMATRMLGYLYRVSNPRVEDMVDEMLAILQDREFFIEKKKSEKVQSAISDMYRNAQDDR